MRHSLLMLAALMLLTACGSGVSYSGREESTEGMPGVVNGKKVHPTVKLGKPYTVRGITYTPRYEPDYEETGLASWYGPGFHGGQTANGEEFSTNDMTAAHKTLPLPSLVRVTMVKTGKQVIVRINDRGPFARGRIIDLSKNAADKIGLTPVGVAKVKVEYLPAESQRFADLLAQGRSPESINIAREVLPYANNTDIAAAEIREKAGRSSNDPRWFDHINPVSSANAAEPEPLYSDSTPDSAPTQMVSSHDLMPPASLPIPAAKPSPASTASPGYGPATSSPFDQLSKTEVAPPQPPPPARSPPPVAAPPPGIYVQLGTYSVEENAQKVKSRVASIGAAQIYTSQVGEALLYRVRFGPYDNAEMAEEILDRAHAAGLADARLVHL